MHHLNTERQRKVKPYDRDKVLQYAHKWAYARNPAYYDFEKLGETVLILLRSVYAGSGIMNYTHVYGWYYTSSYNRTASWTGVNYLYEFLVNNKGVGPFAEVVDAADAQPGDIAQLSFSDSKWYDHSPVIVKMPENKTKDGILVAAHTFDSDYYRLMDFEPAHIRFLHIVDVRIWG